jgi:imidazole glycerol-phosphate synthase subunit HisF
LLAKRIIPSLLLRDDRLVKGVRFANYQDAGNPVTTARAHNAQGADELILIDIDASRENRGPRTEIIEQVAAECFMPLTVAGGVYSLEEATYCMNAGADKLCLNTTALDRPELINELAQVFGAQAIVVSIDIDNGGNQARIMDFRNGQPWPDSDPAIWIQEAISRGAGEIRLMAYDREGTKAGLPCDLIAKLAPAITTPLIVEGGVGSFQHIAAGFDAGAGGVSLGSVLVFEDNNLVKVRRALKALGQHMRT